MKNNDVISMIASMRASIDKKQNELDELVKAKNTIKPLLEKLELLLQGNFVNAIDAAIVIDCTNLVASAKTTLVDIDLNISEVTEFLKAKESEVSDLLTEFLEAKD